MRNTLIAVADWIKEGGEWYCRPEQDGAVVYAGALPEAAYIAQTYNAADADEIIEVRRLLALTVEYTRAIVDMRTNYVSELTESMIAETGWQYVAVPEYGARGWIVAPPQHPSDRWQIWLQTGFSAGGFVYLSTAEFTVLMSAAKAVADAHS